MEPRLNALCSNCQRFVDFFEHDYQAIQKWSIPDGCRWLEDQSEWLHSTPHRLHSNMGQLRDHAAKGCHLCTILRRHVLTISSEAENLPIHIRPHTSWRKQPLKVSINSSEIEVSLRLANSLPIGEDIFDKDGRPPPMAHFTENGVIPDAIFSMIKDWMKHCETHPSCHQTQASNLPTRVIDIGTGESESDPVLFVTKGVPGRYLTLSHRWGKSTPRTTNDNLEAHCRGIRLNSLPKTYQDAILVTRRLGIRYLWIDSLCIIQDSVIDWEHESSRMADIYQGTFCNLSADGALEGNVGLFLERSRIQVTACKIQSSIKECYSGCWYILPLSDDYHYLHEHDLFGPLSSRGWILQERLLPCKTVHFLPNQIVWECRRTTATERQYLREEVSGSKAEVSGEVEPAHDLLTRIFTGTFSDLGDVMYPAWYKLVELYTLRNLTVVEDRFPALWSLAKVFQKASGDRYVAGLWEKDLLRGLVFSRKTEDKLTLGANSTAPSWSWAALEGEVKFGDYWYTTQKHHGSPHDAKIIDIEVSEREENSMGRVSRAAITLSAYCTVGSCELQTPPRPRETKPVHPVREKPGTQQKSHFQSRPRFRLGGRERIEELPHFDRYRFGGFNNNETPFGNTTWWREVKFPAEQSRADDIPKHTILFDKREVADKYAGKEHETITVLYITGGLEDGTHDIRGLAVVPTDGSEKEYRRVGVVYLDDYHMLQDPPHFGRAWDRREVTII